MIRLVGLLQESTRPDVRSVLKELKKSDSPSVNDALLDAERRAKEKGHALGSWMYPTATSRSRRTECTLCGASAIVTVTNWGQKNEHVKAHGNALSSSCHGKLKKQAQKTDDPSYSSFRSSTQDTMPNLSSIGNMFGAGGSGFHFGGGGGFSGGGAGGGY